MKTPNLMANVLFLQHRRTSVINSGCSSVLFKSELFEISTPFALESESKHLKKAERAAAAAAATTTTPFSSSSAAAAAAAGASSSSSSEGWLEDAAIEDALNLFVGTHPELFAANSRNEEKTKARNGSAKMAAACAPSSFFFQNCASNVFLNMANERKVIVFHHREFVLPPNSCGLLGTLGGDISAEKLLHAAETVYKSKGKFDLIVADPPWQNKSVKRRRLYATESAKSILCDLPIKQLLADDGVVVFWYTHNETHHDELLAQLACWGFDVLANWTWLKVTTSGRPVCPFGRNFKKPYEHLIIAGKLRPKGLPAAGNTILVSVPSAIHSHKPNLDEVLESVAAVSSKPCRRLELYARSLKSGWICAGNEVIKLQSSSLFRSEAKPS